MQDAPTGYRSQQGALYPLSALLFFLRNRGLPGGQYMSAATRAGVTPVSLLDRRVNAHPVANPP